MRKHVLLINVILQCLFTNAQYNLVWQNSETSGKSISASTADAADNLLLAGFFSNSITFGTSTRDLFLAKYTTPAPPITHKAILGPAEKMISVFELYPNPAVNQIIIRNRESKMLGNILIYDDSGKMVFQKFINKPQTIIDVQQLDSGVYYLRTGKTAATLKFIKK